MADTFPSFVTYHGIDIKKLKNASETQRSKFYILLAMIEKEIPDYADYLFDRAHAVIKDLQTSPTDERE
jgi:hypothetical protein